MIKPRGRALLLGRGLGAGLLAFEIGGAAFTFDVLVELLAHDWCALKLKMFHGVEGESSTAVGEVNWR
jgi:hypothetical protein